MCPLASHPQRPPSTSGTGAKGVGLGVALGASGLSGTWPMGPLRQAHPGEAPTISNPRNHGSVRSRAKPLYITTEMERGRTTNPLWCPTYLKVSSSITPDQSLIRSCVETLINLDDLTNQPLLNCSQGQELGWSSSLQMQRWQLTWVLEVHLLLCCWFPPRVPTGPDTDKSAATEKCFDDEVITLYCTTIGTVW